MIRFYTGACDDAVCARRNGRCRRRLAAARKRSPGMSIGGALDRRRSRGRVRTVLADRHPPEEIPMLRFPFFRRAKADVDAIPDELIAELRRAREEWTSARTRMVTELLQPRPADPAHEPGLLSADFWMAA
jgi:hypothetical protein